MKKMIIYTVVIVSVCLAITLTVSASLQDDGKITEATEPFTEPVYILKSENDKIVVYDKYSGASQIIEDSAVSVLPESDREQLERGIKVVGEKNKRRLIEDFCS